MKIPLILIAISAFAKAICDSIRFHPASFIFQGDWWLGKGEYLWSNRTWIEANIYSFISDGWHFFDAVRITSLLLLAGYYIFLKEKFDNNRVLFLIVIAILGYVYHGLIFELFYRITS